jgi:hypothetical protein
MAAGSDRPLSELSEDELRAYLPQTETAQFVFGWNLRIGGTDKLTAFDAALKAVAEEPERGDALGDVLREVQAERVRQAGKHGDQSHLPDGTGPDAILLELYQLTWVLVTPPGECVGELTNLVAQRQLELPVRNEDGYGPREAHQ